MHKVTVFRLGASRWALMMSLSLGHLGCANVSVSGADVRERFYPGIVVLEIHPKEADVTMVRTKGLGMVFGPSSATFGFMEESAVFAQKDASCRVMVFIDDNAMHDNGDIPFDAKRINHVCAFKAGELK